MSDKPLLVLYHGNCPDGFGAAWCVWLVHGDDAEYVPCNYGDAPPDVTGRDVFILDFSWPREALIAMHARARSLEVLDHHKTAEADLAGLDFCTFDMERSGATLAWDRCIGSPTTRRDIGPVEGCLIERTFVEYLTDRDLWRFRLRGSREFSAALWSCRRDFDTWTACATNINGLIAGGVSILRYQGQLVEAMVKQAVWRDIGGHRVPVVNASVCFSEVGEALCIAHPEAPFAAYYFDRADGKRQWGSRSRGDFDVSEVAKRLGGGGHKGAAGWTDPIP